MEHFFNNLKLSIHLLVPGDLDAMKLEGVGSHIHEEESLPTDLAVCLAGVGKIVADLAGARIVYRVVERSCVGLLRLDTSLEGGVWTRRGAVVLEVVHTSRLI